MASIHQIRGAILEEAVAHLLRMVGYRVATEADSGTRACHSGLEVQGRGCWHQIDTLACFEPTPAFMYPLRLLVEAKCKPETKTGIDVVRNAVGAIKDISENFFSYRPPNGDEIQIQRFNYHAAIFSASGYTSVAQQYAIAHQVFLIDYTQIEIIAPLIQAISAILDSHFSEEYKGKIAPVRKLFAELLRDGHFRHADFLNKAGTEHLQDAVRRLREIRGSYFGMLQGRWPLHVLLKRELPQELFRNTDIIECKVYGRKSNTWSFSPVMLNERDDSWFRVQFTLPEEIAELVRESIENPAAIADIKEQHFSYLSLSGKIGGINRIVQLRLSPQWMENYRKRIA